MAAITKIIFRAIMLSLLAISCAPEHSSHMKDQLPYNFQQKQLRVTYVADLASDSGKSVVQSSPNGKTTLGIIGTTIDYQMLAFVQDVLNFTAILYPSNTWANYENNSWDGMAGLVYRNEVDYAADGTYLLRDRVQNFRFLVLGYNIKMTAFFQIPPRTADGYKDIILKMFQNVWPPLTITITILILVLTTVYKTHIGDTVMFIVASISGRGGSLASRRDSVRTFLYVVVLHFYLLNIHLTAKLISKFSLEYKTISSFQDMLAEGYEFMLLNDSLLASTGSVEDMPKYIALEETVGGSLSYVTLNTAIIQLIARTKLVLLPDLDVLEPITKFLHSSYNERFCDVLNEIRLDEKPLRSNGFVRKGQGSNLSDHLNYALIKMWASGNANRFLIIYEQEQEQARPNCRNVIDSTINLPQLKTPCLIFTVSAVLSLIILVIERWLGNDVVVDT